MKDLRPATLTDVLNEPRLLEQVGIAAGRRVGVIQIISDSTGMVILRDVAGSDITFEARVWRKVLAHVGTMPEEHLDHSLCPPSPDRRW